MLSLTFLQYYIQKKKSFKTKSKKHGKIFEDCFIYFEGTILKKLKLIDILDNKLLK